MPCLITRIKYIKGDELSLYWFIKFLIYWINISLCGTTIFAALVNAVTQTKVTYSYCRLFEL